MVAPRICVRAPCETTVAGAQFQFGLPNENARGMLGNRSDAALTSEGEYGICATGIYLR